MRCRNKMLKHNIKNFIKDFYSNRSSIKKYFDLNQQKPTNIFSLNNGIGDCVILNHLLFDDENSRSIYNIACNSAHFAPIFEFNKFKNLNFFDHNNQAIRYELLEFFDLGSGHIIQKSRRALGLPIHLKPKSFLHTGLPKIKNKIGLHLSTGNSALSLSNLNQNPRQIYEKNLLLIKDFIKKQSNQYEFVEFGQNSMGLECKNFCGKNITESIKELSTCEYFIGLNSGFMNIAACFDIKSIIIVNIPTNANEIVLPSLKDIPCPDLNWLYPQNVHLHQDNESPIVPIFNLNNLQKALNGEIYPFWSNEYLELIK